MGKVISVFGSSAPRPGSEAYEWGRRVGRLLAEAGLTVATGGYSGTMTAVSQGAAEAGGHVIGVTSSQIEQFRPLALLGEMWRAGIHAFYRPEYIKQGHLDLLYFAESPETAVAHVVKGVMCET